jgi:lincosamide nucleotidyltransferase A/C/D/E
MHARDAAELVEFLERHGLEIHVDGGWAVDALLGEQTRPHDDLDIALPHEQVPRLREMLAVRGYYEQARRDSWECNFVLADAHGRKLDVHSYTLDADGNNLYGVLIFANISLAEAPLMATRSAASPPSGS